jgi:hypothetical protein
MLAAHQRLDLQETSQKNISLNSGSQSPQTSLPAQQTTSFRIFTHRTGEIISRVLNQRHLTSSVTRCRRVAFTTLQHTSRPPAATSKPPPTHHLNAPHLTPHHRPKNTHTPRPRPPHRKNKNITPNHGPSMVRRRRPRPPPRPRPSHDPKWSLQEPVRSSHQSRRQPLDSRRRLVSPRASSSSSHNPNPRSNSKLSHSISH